MSALSRRDFIKLGGTLGAGLLLGACSACNKQRIFTLQQGVGSNPGDPDADMLGWVFIATDGSIKVAIPSAEMGQGVYTGLAMLVAEELDADFAQVSAVAASVNPQFDNPKMRGGQLTGGSTSTMAFWTPMREVGASARSMLLQAAAEQWKTTPESLKTQPGKVVHPDGRQLTYGALASAAAKLDAPSSPKLKSAKDYRLIGKPQKRLDTPDKVRGTAVFGMDVRLPDMVYAAVEQAHALKGRIAKVEGQAAVTAMPGVLSVHVFDTWVAVIAKGWWQAQQGLKALKVTQDTTGVATPSSADHRAKMLQALNEHGKAKRGKETKFLDVEYEVPLLEHATMSPINCTAHVHAKGCDVWAPTQAQTNSHKAAAKACGLKGDQVRIHTTYLGGGFGRRAETDFIHQAVTLAAKVKLPVQLIWSREETTRHGFYRPAVISRFQVGLNEKGDPQRWSNQMAMPNMLYQKVPAVPNMVWKLTGDVIGIDGAKEPPYAIDDLDVDTLHVELDTPLGFWRAVGHSHNGFFVESVVDELAELAGEDPAAYRRRFYGEHPRHKNVLDALTKMAQWGKKRPEGHHLGLAVHESFGSVVGEVVELSVAKDKTVTLHRIWCAIHCGQVINPDAVQAQMESGIVYGLSAATRGQITLDKGVVQQSNFHDYQVMQMSEIPPIEVHLIPSTSAPTGVGETALPPIAAAVANAIYAATGTRLRRLPFAQAGFNTWRRGSA
jgi:isoquinoline 1-oxidoreductase beta subunit